MEQNAATRLVLVETGAGLAADFANDVRTGLTAPRKRLSCRYLYDATGSALFEAICEAPEYYLTRAEQAILAAHADEVAAACPPGTTLVELGSGSAKKTRTLIAALLRQMTRLRYVPIDISRAALVESAEGLVLDYPQLTIQAIAAEYSTGLRRLQETGDQPKLVLWLGSNIGNFDRGEAARFLGDVRAALAVPDRLLVGVDLRKAPAVLEAAYDDAAGVTARFNLNLLARINRELGGDFDLTRFVHRARWNALKGRVEMHLESRARQRVRIGTLDLEVSFAAGETIFTESSYKYSSAELESLAHRAGFAVAARWFDPERKFALALLAPSS